MDRAGRTAESGFDTSRPRESFVRVVRGVLLEPARFFAGLGGPGPDRVAGPLAFAIICGLISLPLSALVAPYGPLPAGQPTLRLDLLPLFGGNPVGSILIAIGLVVLLPLFVVLVVYIAAAIQHFFVFLFVRDRRGYWGTFPVVAYGSAISLFSWIPVVGYLVGLYGVYITTVGLREMHGTSTIQAFLSALLPALLGLAAFVPALLYPPPGF